MSLPFTIRTFDPEEADYFFVPTMAGCLYDVYGWNQIPMWPPKLHGEDIDGTIWSEMFQLLQTPTTISHCHLISASSCSHLSGTRPFGSANLLREAWKWLSRKYPWFNRTKGQDHIWVMPHDEGACSAPKEIWPGQQCGSVHTEDLSSSTYVTILWHVDI